MADPMEKVEVTAFDTARLKALDQHSLLEHTLAGLLCPLLGVKRQAYTIFFRISNTRARYSIIDALLRDMNEQEARKFWRSIEKKLTKIDSTRNNIVHWGAVLDHGTVGGPDHLKQPKQMYLRPGHSMFSNSESRLTIDDLIEFTDSAAKLAPLLFILDCYLCGHYDDETRATLKKIFPQPITDQTQEALQRCLMPKE